MRGCGGTNQRTMFLQGWRPLKGARHCLARKSEGARDGVGMTRDAGNGKGGRSAQAKD